MNIILRSFSVSNSTDRTVGIVDASGNNTPASTPSSRIFSPFFNSLSCCLLVHSSLPVGTQLAISSLLAAPTGIVAPLWKLRGRVRSQFAVCQLYLRIGLADAAIEKPVPLGAALPQVDPRVPGSFRDTKRGKLTIP